MKRRLTSGWTVIRVVYLLMGIAILAQSIYDQIWLGIGLGAYLTLMGALGFGCASGHCAVTPRSRHSES